MKNSRPYFSCNLMTCLFFIKQEGEPVYGTLKPLRYKASSIPSVVLEVPLLFQFDCEEKWVTNIMEKFVDKFYSYNFVGHMPIMHVKMKSIWTQPILLKTIRVNSMKVKVRIMGKI